MQGFAPGSWLRLRREVWKPAAGKLAKRLSAIDCEGMGGLCLQLGSTPDSGVLTEMEGRDKPHVEPLLIRRTSCRW